MSAVGSVGALFVLLVCLSTDTAHAEGSSQPESVVHLLNVRLSTLYGNNILLTYI